MARIVVPGWPHHVTQRGNRRQTVFFRERDRAVYLEMLAGYKSLYHLTLPGYCLMTNHAHDALIPEYGDSLAKGVGRTHNDFSRWQNIQCHQTGHLWQERFYSCPVDFDSFADVLAYIELNPVRAGLVERPEDYAWSSARAHLSGVDETGLLDMTWWRERFTPESWARFLQDKLGDDRLLRRIRRATATGKPMATESSVEELERRFGKRLKLRGQW